MKSGIRDLSFAHFVCAHRSIGRCSSKETSRINVTLDTAVFWWPTESCAKGANMIPCLDHEIQILLKHVFAHRPMWWCNSKAFWRINVALDAMVFWRPTKTNTARTTLIFRLACFILDFGGKLTKLGREKEGCWANLSGSASNFLI